MGVIHVSATLVSVLLPILSHVAVGAGGKSPFLPRAWGMLLVCPSSSEARGRTWAPVTCDVLTTALQSGAKCQAAAFPHWAGSELITDHRVWAPPGSLQAWLQLGEHPASSIQHPARAASGQPGAPSPAAAGGTQDVIRAPQHHWFATE